MNENTTNAGIGFMGVLTIVFIILKLLGVIDWSWIWVLSPIWISVLIAMIVLIVGILFVGWLNK